MERRELIAVCTVTALLAFTGAFLLYTSIQKDFELQKACIARGGTSVVNATGYFLTCTGGSAR